MQQACGWLRWPPSEFWNATLAEIASAVAGFLEETRGIRPRDAAGEMYDDLIAVAHEAMRANGEM
jgi:hypothetical protein